MPYFMVVTSIRFSAPVRDSDGKLLSGAFQNVGVLALAQSEVRGIVAAAISDGVIDWDDSEIRMMDDKELQDRDFAPFAQGARQGAVWYMSGRCFYTDHDDQPH